MGMQNAARGVMKIGAPIAKLFGANIEQVFGIGKTKVASTPEPSPVTNQDTSTQTIFAGANQPLLDEKNTGRKKLLGV